MADFESLDDLETQMDALEDSAGRAGQMVAAFDGEMQRLRASLQTAGGD
jgi:hypothetical protein